MRPDSLPSRDAIGSSKRTSHSGLATGLVWAQYVRYTYHTGQHNPVPRTRRHIAWNLDWTAGQWCLIVSIPLCCWTWQVECFWIRGVVSKNTYYSINLRESVCPSFCLFAEMGFQRDHYEFKSVMPCEIPNAPTFEHQRQCCSRHRIVRDQDWHQQFRDLGRDQQKVISRPVVSRLRLVSRPRPVSRPWPVSRPTTLIRGP